ncbi:MAG: XTP/dITP diphosphatase [Actinobacteria bacterium]|nr:XTP/dITP diphosphatase [Actinomycetota bacterium]
MKNEFSLVIATKNKGKFREIKHYLKDSNINLLSLNDFEEIPEIVEDGRSFRENSLKKARIIAKALKKPALADDSGLEVDFLNGNPGVYSSRYSGEGATDKSNRDKLLSELSNIKDLEGRLARFVCHLVFWDPQKGLLFETDGVCEGNIGFEETGSGGFGYDCIFIPRGFDRTMAQLSEDEKNKISHRGKALKKFASFIEENKYLF